MKTFAIAAALLAGTAAFAQPPASQTGTPPVQQPDPADDQVSQTGQADADTNTPQPTTQPSGQPMQGQSTTMDHSRMNHGQAQQNTAQPGMAQPGMTQPGMAQQGQNQGQTGSWTGQGGPVDAGARDYPPCSRTVTDRCIQNYERGVRGPRGRR